MNHSSKKSSVPLANLGIQFSESDREAIDELSVLAHELTGVQLTERHQSMVASRLNKRMLELQLGSLRDYVDYFHLNRGQETPKLISLLTTHHTYFFREFSHFEFIQNQVLPTLVPLVKARSDKKIRIWAAACSRGQEVYSLAMFFEHHLRKIDFSLSYEILATDVDPESVAIAQNGVYLKDELKEVPLAFLADHWAKGTGEIEAFVKAKKTLRDHCRFQTANLFELKPGSQPNEKFDIIFCRNVFIYFNPDQIKSITRELLARLSPEGYFFIGISESLTGLSLPVGSPGPSVYRHKEQQNTCASKVKIMPFPAAIASAPKNIRVLCVDDSPSVLTLMKKILSKEEGFEIIGTAQNGLEAAKQVQALKPDVLTLDIHMPEQTGLEYLEKNFKAGHPPVVMVTSVSRENADLAGKALALGAADYIEKPALNNLTERGEEIRNKLRCALLATANPGKTSFDQAFQKSQTIIDSDEKLRIVVLPLSSRAKLKALLSEFSGTQPHCAILVEGASDALVSMAAVLSKETNRKIAYSEQIPSELRSNEITLFDFSSVKTLWERFGKARMTSMLVFGDVSKTGAEKLQLFRGAQFILEDLGSGKGAKALMGVASDVVPSTSFAYLSAEFFSQKRKAA